mgnify:CR=1 FL=1
MNQRMRTGYLVNWQLLREVELTPAGYPIIHPAHVPDGISDLLGFNEAKTCRHPEDFGLHFWIDDYQFERVWAQPERYLPMIQRFAFVIEPDFSTYEDWPQPLQQWNYYRNQLLAAWWQARGVTVIPYPGGPGDWGFEGAPLHSDIAFSTVGALCHREARLAMPGVLRTSIEHTAPTQVLVYGSTTPEIEKVLRETGTPWIHYAHGQLARMRQWQYKAREETNHGKGA